MTDSRKWYRTTAATVALHVFWWSLWLLLPSLFRREQQQTYREALANVVNPLSLVFTVCWLILFYLNAYLLIPRLWYRKRVWLYVLVLVAMCAGVLLLGARMLPVDDHHKHGPHDSWFLIFPFLMIWALSSVFRFVTDRVQTEQLIQEKENENLKTELAFLRSQVSPHFLFNVLNNMVGMARLKSSLLEPSLIRLSELMRYMLYESDEDKVPLDREIDYVKSFIELQRLRFSKSLLIREQFPEDPSPYLIEPMLLIPFIENAFKHGTGMIVEPVMDVVVGVNEGWLTLRVRNKFDESRDLPKDKTSGIGLANVARRLNLLYGSDHELHTGREGDWYVVSLRVKLKT